MTGKFLTIALAGCLIAASGATAFAQTARLTPEWHSQWHRQGLRATRALNLLEDRNDGQFSDFRASGTDFTANVTKGSTVMPVLIEPDQRRIQPLGNVG